MTTIRVPRGKPPGKNAERKAEAEPCAFPPPDGGWTRSAARCDLCDAPMYELHCKLVCPNCGYKRDCNDP